MELSELSELRPLLEYFDDMSWLAVNMQEVARAKQNGFLETGQIFKK